MFNDPSMHTEQYKENLGKPPLALLDRYALEEIAKVLAFGAKKYHAHSYREGIDYSKLLDASLRHIFAFVDGEDLDPESGLLHLAHAACNLLFMMRMTKDHPELDDRYAEREGL